MVALFLQVLPLITIGLVHCVPTPLILISGPRVVIEYRKLQLQCVTSAEHTNLLWYFSSNGSDAQYEQLNLHPSSSVRLKSNGATLIIRSATKADVGSYRCCASEAICTKMNLFVLSAADDHSLLEPTNDAAVNSGVLDVPSDGSFSLAIYHAPFNGEIYIEAKPTVSFCDHFLKHARECSENRSYNTVSYNVRNGTIRDSGRFVIKILFNQHLEQFHLHILIRGGPIVHMNNYSVLNNLTHVNLQCRGYAYPTPNISFTYTPCDPMKMDHSHGLQKQHCGKSTTLPQHLARLTPFNYTTSYEVIVPSWPLEKGPGIVSCQAWNSEGITETETFLYVRNFLEPMLFSVVSPTDVVLYDDTVKMTCQVDVYNFTNQFTIHHGGYNSFNLSGQRFHYAWAVTFLVHITNASQNEVSCAAHHKNGTALVTTLNLLIKYPSKPHIVSVNDTVNATIAFGDRIRLECDIEGTPTPDIVWFKNDDHLRNEQGYFIRVSLDPDEIRATYKCIGRTRLGKAIKTWHITLEDTWQWLFIGVLGATGFVAMLLIGTIIWIVGAYRQILARQIELEEQQNRTEDA